MNFYWLILSIVLATPASWANEKSTPLSNESCINCHTSQANEWHKSDHAKAMAIAANDTILGDFNNKSVEHYGQKATFFIKDGVYQVTISYDNNTQTLPIKYTFGHFPLQQYIVETEPGSLQILPFAWDSRAIKDGGQRWYHNYSHEEIRPEDRLHWRQPLQNWNGMCADCHSDGLTRNYDNETNHFKSEFDNINVGCLSCHGDMSAHEKSAKSVKTRNVYKDVISNKHPTGRWLRTLGKNTASWHGEKRDNSFMDSCFACHSLRSPLTDGIKAHVPFLDQFTPQLLSAPNYYPDGQIKEEVYVYGSFLQSKMFAAGVNCLDCHDKHTMKVKIEGNGLCLQCHSGDVFNVKGHHQHEDKSEGAQCVNCHMPESRFMGVDDRRDHSFKIPRPDLSKTLGSPNACIKCHENQSNQWAEDKLVQWHGQPKPLLTSKTYLFALNAGHTISLEQHLTIIADEQLAVISRATALEMLAYTTPTISAEILDPYLTHQEDLLRLSAVKASALLNPKERIKYVSPLLSDKRKSIRIEAARNLVSIQLTQQDLSVFTQAFNELVTANEVSSWRGEGRVNQGLLAMEINDVVLAEKRFKEAIKIEPYFDAGYINLAGLYRSQQRQILVQSVLSQGLKKVPQSGELHYEFGLYLVRKKELKKAVTYFKKAVDLTPTNARYAYTWILSIDGLGETKQALNELKLLIVNYQDKTELKELGLYLSQKLYKRADYQWFSQL
ncbi:multiheme c-type cytochrome [Colwellia sp. 1_MG-2023]|uniref:multiheme c-type cytochrome n=1 Tax=unclassified Colwellia TaxID=196834 RepID=UPI0020914A8B|nr:MULTISPECIES: multiheme c-type cytochrome [unclassified Colwellia]MDO6652985.1 multiheme c-type cytochrome [Colwellia sp. 3_MG-2023]MDO6665467.1 multiheme c-type cytochrome [Colwellia sp. 2_MG-2023]MDO6689774.1 multiheme c-type cytochrome [Colwellia sp. 1_MG-2023]